MENFVQIKDYELLITKRICEIEGGQH